MNRLHLETSPYLLQHAENPVDWFPWGEAAFAKARAEDKPMLVSIGYSACHWCHVMAHESFEDPATAAFMNEHFVNVKIDREERPDVDAIYMEAVQAISGAGGWPLNVFLNPDGKPFYGGTYFPPQPAHGRPSWRQVLESLSRAFREKRTETEAQADNLTEHIARSGNFGIGAAPASPFTRETMATVAQTLLATADREEGGFGRAPKFPQTFSIRFLLQHHFYTKDPAALEQACLSLDKMITGGIFDQLGGGLARYSTDRYWLAPHFEKMLYDNALLIAALTEAWQLTGAPRYREAVTRTMAFVARELAHPEGGFYAALDADSEGEEGRFYVWDEAEISGLLGDEAPAFCAYYDVTPAGNWEGKNILRRRDLAKPPDPRFERARQRLFAARAGRTRPGLDDKVITGWNALMIAAAARAGAAMGEPAWIGMALRAMSFLETRCAGPEGHLFCHTWKNGRGGIPAFLDDYASLLEACLALQEATRDLSWLQKAGKYTEFVLAHFGEENGDYFFFTHEAQEDVILRKKELFDGATASGNSTMAGVLLALGIIFDKKEWKSRAESMATGLAAVLAKYPGSFGGWATMANALAYGMIELAVTGTDIGKDYMKILTYFIPNRVLLSTTSATTGFPLLDDKPVSDAPLFFLCRDYSCQTPVTEPERLIPLLETF